MTKEQTIKSGEGETPQNPQPERPDEEKRKEMVNEAPDGDKKFYELVKSLQTSMTRFTEPNMPVWSSEWTDSENQTSFKAHAKAFESHARMLQWDQNMKALKFQMTLRGKIRQHIDTLDEETATNYDLLKKELMSVYHETKDPHTKIHEWNAIVWRPKSMKLQRLGALLLTGYKAFMNKENGSEKTTTTSTVSELMLKDRFLKAVREGHPKFAKFIELNRPQNQTYKELVSFCANKFQVYKHEIDIEEEDDVVALVAADDGRRLRQDYTMRDRYEGDYNRQNYRPRGRSMDRGYGERLRQIESARIVPQEESLYDRRRNEWRQQNAWKYEQYDDRYRYDGNRYRQDEYQMNRYQSGRDRDYDRGNRDYDRGNQFRGQQWETTQSYTPRRPLAQPMRGGYAKRMSGENREQRGFNDRREWQEGRRGNWNNGGRRRYNDDRQQEQTKRDHENGKKGTTVPENRKITFLEEKAKN